MQKTDTVRLRHMLDAAREALAFAHGRSRTDLDRDRMLVLALVKSIEIIGEAALPGYPPKHVRLFPIYPGRALWECGIG
jgi:uncharacterized protein with HEPN domain